MSSVRVIAVEDERLVARDLKLRLMEMGYEVPGLASSASEAIQMIEEFQPQVVLMDVRLEGEPDGIEAAKVLRDRFDVAVVFVTAHADVETVRRASAASPYGYVLKPFDDRELRAAIEIAVYKHQAEEKLRETEERLRHSQRIANLGNWEQDLLTQHMQCSTEACKILGVAADECGSPMPQARFLELIHPEDRPVVHEALKATATESKPLGVEHRVVESDGSERVIRLFGEVVSSRATRKRRILGTAQDITEYRHLEEKFQRAQKLEAVGQLAGGVAHDFNNLLVVIRGYTEMILSDLPSRDPLAIPLQEISAAADRAAGLTRQLLAFSRRQVMRQQLLDLNTLIRDLEKMLRRILFENIEVRKDLSATWRVRADPGQVEQIIMNLVVNARDAMPKGGVLTVSTADVELTEHEIHSFIDLKTGRYVRMSVMDDGTGISPEIRDRLFEPFFTTKPAGEGTGLGLSMVYGIAKQHGGDVSVYSDLGRGTVFHVYLPATEQIEAAPQERTIRQSPYRGTETILLVEDDDGVRKLAEGMLKRLGYTVLIARNGQEALGVARTSGRKVDLLLTDVVMPQMNGQELADQMRALQPDVKLVFMSGYPGRVTSNFGVSDANMVFLQKPFSSQDLGRRIRDALGS